MRGFFFLFQQGIGGIKRETACPGGVEEALQWRRKVERKWARELEGGWERERGRGGSYCIPVASVQSNKI